MVHSFLFFALPKIFESDPLRPICCKGSGYLLTVLRFIPEEELLLCQFLTFVCVQWKLSKCIRMIAGIIHFRGERHGCWREVLNLFEMEMQPLWWLRPGAISSSVQPDGWKWNREWAADSACIFIDAVKQLLKVSNSKRRLTHHFEYFILGMLGSHFQTSWNVMCNQFFGIVWCSFAQIFILVMIKQQIVTDAASNEGFLIPGILSTVLYKSSNGVWSAFRFGQTTGEMQEGFLHWWQMLSVFAFHLIHIGGRSTQITQITFEVRHLCNCRDLFDNWFFTAWSNKLYLDALKSCKRRIHRNIRDARSPKTWSSHRQEWPCLCISGEEVAYKAGRTKRRSLPASWAGRADWPRWSCLRPLDEALRFVFVWFLFYMSEVLGLFKLVFETFFVRIEFDVIILDRFMIWKVNSLFDIMNLMKQSPLSFYGPIRWWVFLPFHKSEDPPDCWWECLEAALSCQ